MKPTVNLTYAIGLSLAVATSAMFFLPQEAGAQTKRKLVRNSMQNFNSNPNARLELQRKPILKKPEQVSLTSKRDPKRIVVKFVDGTRVRMAKTLSKQENKMTSANLAFTKNKNASYQQKLLQQVRLSESSIKHELESINQLITPTTADLEPLYSQSPQLLRKLRQNTEKRSGKQSSDLSNYYTISTNSANQSMEIANALNKLKIVESVYFAPKATKLPDLPPTTPNFQANQNYLLAAPTGIDANYAWTIPGGNGANITIADIEYDWNLTHEDLPPVAFRIGDDVTRGVLSDQDHGTAVLGMLVGQNDRSGVTGIAYGARAAVVSALDSKARFNVAESIILAALELRSGDVILLEQQTGDHEGALVPVEYLDAEFDAIVAATNLGVIDVEAAGNGSTAAPTGVGQNLDAGVYDRRFDPTFRHSGAIMVAASNSTDRDASSFSNYGRRIDLHGWGDSIMSLGYGSIGGNSATSMRPNGLDRDQWYRLDFGGTSGASAMIAGAIATVQGARLANGDQPMGFSSMVQLLTNTGTQFTGSNAIGSFPDLGAALQQLYPNSNNTPGGTTPNTTPSPLYQNAISLGNATTTQVAGVSSNRTDRLYGNDSGLRALARLEFGERSDEPCFVKGFRRDVTNVSEGSHTRDFDECKSNKGPTNSSLKLIPKNASADKVFIHGIEICMSKTKNDNRIKGVRLRQSSIESDGLVERIPGSTSTYPELTRPNCKSDWKPAKLCPLGSLATDLVVHHFADKGGRSISGIALECREVKVDQVCVENCPN